MATRLDDLDQYFQPGLVLTVLGAEYTIPLPSADLGLWCRRMAIATGEIHNASSEQEIRAAVARVEAVPEMPGDMSLAERVLGPVYEQMRTAEVPDHYIQYCATTAYIWIISDEETAGRWWRSGGRPEALRPAANRAQRRAAAKGGSSRTTSTGEASTTPSRGSGTGTRSQQRSGGGGSRSRGRRSSPGGG
ncbi:hypothetical protein ACFFMR_18865 [Micromonospora andamanensis]|uniref:DUF7426 family protein n=1 Tax=Micromonospora andamanensis TaxID=1287068 RepID=UPI001EF1C4D1|nr:hypothetical protein [Micromonospora andamanensis]